MFHALRDRLTPPEADQVAAQLLALLKEICAAGERVDPTLMKLHRSKFLERVRQERPVSRRLGRLSGSW
jgi:uncharacterized protein (DUF2267 family)